MFRGLPACGLLAVIVSLALGPATAQPPDPLWVDWFAGPGTAGPVTRLTSYQGRLLVTGDLRQAGLHLVDRHAAWDPGQARWSPHGDLALRSLRGEAFSFLETEAGLVAGGDLHPVVPGGPGHVARWDGTTWTDFGAGQLPGPVRALGTHQGTLFAGGAGGVSGLDAGTWQLRAGLDGTVHALLSHPAGLIAGGDFSVDGLPAHVALWDGTTWAALDNGTDGPVLAMVLRANGDVVLGGSFGQAGGTNATNLATWDGTQLRELAGGATGRVEALALDDDGHVVVGGAFVALGSSPIAHVGRLVDDTWEPLGRGLDGIVRSLVVDAGGLFAGGDFLASGDVFTSHVARFDGQAWRPLNDPRHMGAEREIDAIAVLGDQIVVGGFFRYAGNERLNYIARWDGERWRSMDTGFDQGPVHTLATDGDRLYAGGMMCYAGDLVTDSVAIWDGNAWLGLGSGMNDPVRGMAVDTNHDVYAVGEFDEADFRACVGIARWDGTQWFPVGGGLSQKTICVTARDGHVYAGGRITQYGNIAHWDGESWQPMGEGMDNVVTTITISRDGTQVFAGGQFERAGQVEAKGIARWDGTRWHAMGDGFQRDPFPTVRRILDTDDGIYAGGLFNASGPVDLANLAYWDGATWSPVSVGTGGQIKNLALLGTDLWVVGDFATAGRRSSRHVSAYTLPQRFATALGSVDLADTGTGVRITWEHPPSSALLGFEVARTVGQSTTVLAGPALLGPAARAFVDEGITGGVRATYTVVARGRSSLESSASADIDLPDRVFALEGNTPNPFNPSTTVWFTLPAPGQVRLTIHDLAGRRVATLLEADLGTGRHSATWDGRDGRQRRVASGSYVARIEWNGQVRSGKLTLLK